MINLFSSCRAPGLSERCECTTRTQLNRVIIRAGDSRNVFSLFSHTKRLFPGFLEKIVIKFWFSAWRGRGAGVVQMWCRCGKSPCGLPCSPPGTCELFLNRLYLCVEVLPKTFKRNLLPVNLSEQYLCIDAQLFCQETSS